MIAVVIKALMATALVPMGFVRPWIIERVYSMDAEMIVPVAIFVALMVFVAVAILFNITAPCNPIPANSVIQPTATFQQAPKGYVCTE